MSPVNNNTLRLTTHRAPLVVTDVTDVGRTLSAELSNVLVTTADQYCCEKSFRNQSRKAMKAINITT